MISVMTGRTTKTGMPHVAFVRCELFSYSDVPPLDKTKGVKQMNEQFIAILQKISTDFGADILGNLQKFKGLLGDYTKGEYKKECGLITLALDCGCYKAIAASKELDITRLQLIQKLQDEKYIAEAAAQDAVDTLLLMARGYKAGAEPDLPKPAVAPASKDANAAGNKTDDVESHYAKGQLFRDRGDYNTAITEYTKAIELDPNNAEYYKKRGEVYYLKNDYDSAIADCTQVIKLDPNNAGFYYNRGVVYYLKNDYDSAIADYTQAIKLDPNDAEFYYNRGNVYFGKKDYDSAIADYTKAIKLDPNNAEYEEHLAWAQAAKKGK
jgi:tetratricopeptide (TPR) repeat protein